MRFHDEGVRNRVVSEDTTGFLEDVAVSLVSGHLHPVFGVGSFRIGNHHHALVGLDGNEETERGVFQDGGGEVREPRLSVSDREDRIDTKEGRRGQMTEDRESGLERTKGFGIHRQHDAAGVEGVLRFGVVLRLDGDRDVVVCLFDRERLPSCQEDTASLEVIIRHSLDEGRKFLSADHESLGRMEFACL